GDVGKDRGSVERRSGGRSRRSARLNQNARVAPLVEEEVLEAVQMMMGRGGDSQEKQAKIETRSPPAPDPSHGSTTIRRLSIECSSASPRSRSFSSPRSSPEPSTPTSRMTSSMLRSRWIAVPLSALLWATCVAVVILWTPLVLLYRLFTFPWDRDRYRVGRLFHDSAAFVARVNPFWKFRILDDVHPDDRRPYVFVANHSSFTDVFLLASLPWEMKFLSKKTIFRIPLLGWQMTIAGDVPIVRGDKANVQAAIRQLRERLDRRLSVIFFPEGTRS